MKNEGYDEMGPQITHIRLAQCRLIAAENDDDFSHEDLQKNVERYRKQIRDPWSVVRGPYDERN